uniref:Uncharacterized protein n=1 Tax=Timema douglasi TaxID=61478 RepID=A0A7R8ZCF0_TIMDO|nr:unnamed protein product [Timema douglasi]
MDYLVLTDSSQLTSDSQHLVAILPGTIFQLQDFLLSLTRENKKKEERVGNGKVLNRSRVGDDLRITESGGAPGDGEAEHVRSQGCDCVYWIIRTFSYPLTYERICNTTGVVVRLTPLQPVVHACLPGYALQALQAETLNTI